MPIVSRSVLLFAALLFANAGWEASKSRAFNYRNLERHTSLDVEMKVMLERGLAPSPQLMWGLSLLSIGIAAMPSNCRKSRSLD